MANRYSSLRGSRTLTKKARIAVIGGGMSGLELANELAARETVRVEVIERGPATRKEHVLWDGGTHLGDEKTRRWAGEGWGPGGGLSERLGGRSLCYHGVFLGVEAPALAAWPVEWIDRLEGHYRTLPQELEGSFPELRQRFRVAEGLGLRHVPQAAVLSADRTLMKAYTPLTRATALAEAGTVEIVRAAVVRVHPRGRSWIVDVTDPEGTPGQRGPFDACVLTSSAIGNVQLLSRSLDREVETNLTDHLCVGGLVRLPPGRPLTEYRNRKLWAGYLPVPELNTNIFVREFEPAPNGDRLLDIHAVVEQDASDEGSSTLLALPRSRPEAHITPMVSEEDEAKLVEVRHRVSALASLIGQEPVRALAESPGTLDQARAAIATGAPNSVAYYRMPYGEYEHESSTHPIGGKAIEVGTDLEVAELPGVHVAGPGAFPRMGAANPALTILAMSRSLAAVLHGRYS
nr:GMC oxidoreductase [Lentzea xinjiangensis]